MMKLPPGLFSTTTLVFKFSAIFCATSRAWTSVPPPAGSPTIMRIGRLGKSCAAAAAGAASALSRRPANPGPRPKNAIAFSPELLRLDVGVLGDLGVDREFRRQILAPFGGLGRERLHALFAQRLDDAGVGDGFCHLVPKLLRDRRRRTGRSENSEPAVHLVVRKAGLLDGRHVGQRRRAL